MTMRKATILLIGAIVVTSSSGALAALDPGTKAGSGPFSPLGPKLSWVRIVSLCGHS